MRKRFPGATWDIAASELSRQVVEMFARFILAFAQREFGRSAIVRGLWNLARQRANDLVHTRLRSVAPRIFFGGIVNVFSGPPVRDDAGSFQLGEMSGDARLTHFEDLLQFSDRKLFLLEKQEQAEPGRIGQKTE